MKKIGLICLALVMALGSLGVAYAMWSDSVTVNANVSTGYVCYHFSSPLDSLDPCDSGQKDYTANTNFIGGVFLPTLYPAKDVGCTTVEKVDDHHVQVTLYNTYPCYANEITLHMENCGTIPLISAAPILTYLDINGNPVVITLNDGWVYNIPGWDQYGTFTTVLQFEWVNNTGAQREPGGTWEDSFYVHVMQAADENAIYRFWISRTAEQYNESIYYP